MKTIDLIDNAVWKERDSEVVDTHNGTLLFSADAAQKLPPRLQRRIRELLCRC